MLQKFKEILEPDVRTELKLIGISAFISTKFTEFAEKIQSLELRQLQKGDKGDKGEKGDKGKDGRDGINGRDGLNGVNGKDGKDGVDGKDGISVTQAYIDIDGHLTVKLSNGKEIDAGAIEVDGQSLAVMTKQTHYQIHVSTTAPTNPQVNDLWLDIN